MGKKAKGGGGGPKEALPTEAESTLLLKISALEEKLAEAQGMADAAVSKKEESVGALDKQRKDQKDIVDFLNLQLDKKKEEYADLERRFARLTQDKDAMEKRLKKEIGDLNAKIEAQDAQLKDRDAQIQQLNDQVIEIGQLRSGRDSDVSFKASLQEELEMVKYQLHESNLHLKVLAAADDRLVGDDGARALPLLLLEAIRLHIAKPVLCEQAMVAMQYVISEAHGHPDAEIIRRRGGVELVLDAMAKHSESSELQSSACGLLWKLAFADPPMREVVIKNNGMAAIMGGMQRHTSHPRLQYNACGALRQMLVTAPRQFSKESQIAPGSRPEVLPPIDARRAGRRPMRGLPHDPRTLCAPPPRPRTCPSAQPLTSRRRHAGAA